jgi:hypothetical protein
LGLVMKKILILLGVGFTALGISIQPSAATAVVTVPGWSITGGLSINTFLGVPVAQVGQPVTSPGHTSLSAETFFGPASVTADIDLSPTPSISLTSSGKGAVGIAALTYYFAVIGPSGSVPISINAKGSTTPGVGQDSFLVQTTVNPAFAPLLVSSPTQGEWTISGEYDVVANVIYRVSLQVGASNGSSSYIDPTFLIDPAYSSNYSLIFSAGIVNGVPEPSTWAMMLIGFAGLGYMGLRSRRRVMVA